MNFYRLSFSMFLTWNGLFCLQENAVAYCVETTSKLWRLGGILYSSSQSAAQLSCKACCGHDPHCLTPATVISGHTTLKPTWQDFGILRFLWFHQKELLTQLFCQLMSFTLFSICCRSLLHDGLKHQSKWQQKSDSEICIANPSITAMQIWCWLQSQKVLFRRFKRRLAKTFKRSRSTLT